MATMLAEQVVVPDEEVIGVKRKISHDDSSSKKKAKGGKDLYRQPTVEELNQLRETENLFHSNLFRLQIEEVLTATNIKNKYKKFFDSWLENFKKCVTAISDAKEYPLSSNDLINGVHIPMQDLPNECVGTLSFTRPSCIMVGGSYLYDTLVGPDCIVDVLVEMPESLFQKIDCKNYRYMRKKALYLAMITSHINESLAETKNFAGSNANPVLKIVPPGKLGKKFTIHVHIVVQETTFLMSKFTPEKNNVKPNWFFNASDKNSEINPPTPYYNSIVLQDLSSVRENLHCSKMIKEYPNIRDGIILLKIWLKQRELFGHPQSFNGHIITMCVLYLLYVKKLNTFMSSYQIVRNTWQYLASSNWCKEGISLCQDEKAGGRISEYHKHYDSVFLGSNGYLNLTANVLEDALLWVSNQAKQAIECLNNTRINGFQILFMRKVPFYKAFDQMISIHNVKALENVAEAHSSDADRLNYGSNKYQSAIKLILKLLKEGLGNRVPVLCCSSRKMKEWGTGDEIPSDLERIYIGMQLDPSYAMNILDKGPSANLPEAESFRKFWGDKSELRRFKDGTICEVVVWQNSNATLAKKRAIPLKVTKYLMESKMKLFENKHFYFFSNQVEDYLKLNKVKVSKFSYGPEEASLQVINAFAALEKEVTGLTDLPLSVSGLQGSSPVFRYSDPFPPLACVRRPDGTNVLDGDAYLHLSEELVEVPLYLAPVNAILQLSTSGKWPDDLTALRLTKAAFHLQIAERLRSQCKLRARGLMNHIEIMKDGWVFRIRIAHQKEIGLLKQIKDEDGVIKYRDNEQSIKLENELFHLPKLSGALYGIHCQEPSFGPACCLAKRWLSAQLIDDHHIPDIVVELLMASIYLNPDPFRAAQLPQVAFIRFLDFFAVEQWSTDPIIVNFNDEMTREEIVEVENSFGTSRDTLPPLFIVTPYDKELSIWTKSAPTRVILNRISALAKEALRLLEAQLFSVTSVSFGPLFVPPLSEYDALIHLEISMNSRRLESLKSDDTSEVVDVHPFKEHSLAKIPIAGFDPAASYLSELRDSYDDFALFFHDTYGGSLIGVLIKPQALQEKEFKVANVACQKLNSNKRLALNISAMIEDFYILGKGLVKTIDIQSKKIDAL